MRIFSDQYETAAHVRIAHPKQSGGIDLLISLSFGICIKPMLSDHPVDVRGKKITILVKDSFRADSRLAAC